MQAIPMAGDKPNGINAFSPRLEHGSTHEEEQQSMNDTPSSSTHPAQPTYSYGATQYSSAARNPNNGHGHGSIVQPLLLTEDAWLRQTSTQTRPRRRQEPSSRLRRNNTYRQNRNTFVLWLLQFFHQLHCWIRDVAFVLGSITEDEDYDDGGHSEGESSNDRMTATTSSVSRQYDTHTLASPLTSTIQNKPVDRNVQAEEEDHSSTVTMHRHSSSPTQVLRNLKRKHGKKKIGRIVWLLLLATAYSIERCTFKILLDRMGPFRLVVGTQGILGLYMILLGVGMLWTLFSFGGTKLLLPLCGKKRMTSHSTTTTMSDYLIHAFQMDPNTKIVFLPLADLGMIAVFDSLSLLLAALSASHTTPILIIILVQLNVPLSVLSRYFCVDRPPSSTVSSSQSMLDEGALQQIANKRQRLILVRNLGACVILLSVLVSLLPIYFPPVDPTRFFFHISSLPFVDTTTLWNTALFLFSCLPAAASQAYKHHALVETAQSVHATLMNITLSITSLIFIIFLSPLVYSLQGLGTPITDNMNVTQWIELYPSYTYSSNFHHCIQCILGTISDEVQLNGYPEVAQCQYAWLLVLIHVLSILLMQYALEKMCDAGAPRLIGRGMTWGILFGSTSMFFYGGYDCSSLIFWIGCISILILGSEMYQQTSVKIDTFETVYVNPCGDDATTTER